MQSSTEPNTVDPLAGVNACDRLTLKIGDLLITDAEKGHAVSVSLLREVADGLIAIADHLEKCSDANADALRSQMLRALCDQRSVRDAAEALGEKTVDETTPLVGERLKRVFKRVHVAEVCATCGSSLQLKHGKRGPFMGCTRYPACTTTSHVHLGVACPEEGCFGHLVERSKPDALEPGKVQRFVGCSQYRKGTGCQFVEWHAPERIPCQRCDLPFMLVVGDRRICIDRSCVGESSIDRVAPNANIEKLLKYAQRLVAPMPAAAGLLVTTAGLACGMMNAEMSDVNECFGEGRERGLAWYRDRFPEPIKIDSSEG